MTTSVWLDSPSAIEQHLLRDIPPHDLAEPGVRFIMCDQDNQVMLHAQVSERDTDGAAGAPPELPDDGLGDGLDATITRWVKLMCDHGLLDGLLVAVTRPGRPTLTALDRACFQAARSACSSHAVRLLGVHVVTPGGQREVLLDDAL